MTSHCKSITDTCTIEENTRVYNFSKCLDFIEYQGKLCHVQSFKIIKEDVLTIYKLLIYMIKDKKMAIKQQLDL